jgi:hypothetical protein
MGTDGEGRSCVYVPIVEGRVVDSKGFTLNRLPDTKERARRRRD